MSYRGRWLWKDNFSRVLTGEQRPDSGVIELGDTILMGVYDQLGLKIDVPELPMLEFVVDQVHSFRRLPARHDGC